MDDTVTTQTTTQGSLGEALELSNGCEHICTRFSASTPPRLLGVCVPNSGALERDLKPGAVSVVRPRRVSDIHRPIWAASICL